MKSIKLLFGMSFFLNQSFAQTEPKEVSCDCAGAIEINVYPSAKYGPTVAPNGVGKKVEFRSTSSNTDYIFSKEHNSAWYLLQIERDGTLNFEIEPLNVTDDYDFMLYPYSNESICDGFLEGQPQPVRGNRSRCDTALAGITGLGRGAREKFTAKGPGNSFSEPISVKRGEKYLLVLDNIRNGGNGHRLAFFYTKDVRLRGIVKDEHGNPLQCSVDVLNLSGKSVLHTFCDKQGKYNVLVPMEENANYALVFTRDSFYFGSRLVNTFFLSDNDSNSSPQTEVPILRPGSKFPLQHFVFEGGSARPTRESAGALLGLYYLMKRNPKMSISIVGHTSSADGLSADLLQELSEERAHVVYRYLIQKGIEKSRLSKVGRANTAPLYMYPKSPLEHQANRRLEIELISF